MWDLRAAWGTGRRVSLTIDSDDCRRLEGYVMAVASSGAYVAIARRHVPVERIVAVHLPSRLGDSTSRAKSWPVPRQPTARRRTRGQLALPLSDDEPTNHGRPTS